MTPVSMHRVAALVGLALAPTLARAQAAESVAVRRASVLAAVAGGGGLGGGGYLGMRSHDRVDLADARRPGAASVDRVALRWSDQVQTDTMLATGMVVVGGASVVAAAVLWLVRAPRADEAPVLRPTLSAGQVGVALAGRF